ncbi:hypothetical protein [Clostridium sp.]|uniref:hypothetical protein n=1 Tax=Clostridium sp. TaxID=1506 RepID=UPI0032164A6A
MFRLVRNEKLDHKEIEAVKVYENDYYSLRIFYYKNGYISKDLRKNIEGKSDCYTPHLHLEENNNFLVEEITIETCSYGSMNSEEIQRIIEGYQIAIESVRELKEIVKCML